MPPKRANLAALADAAGSTRPALVEQKPNPAVGSNGADQSYAPASRTGQKPVTGYFDEDVRIQLKMLAAEQRRSMESMIGEALNDLFAKYGKPEIVGVRAEGVQ